MSIIHQLHELVSELVSKVSLHIRIFFKVYKLLNFNLTSHGNHRYVISFWCLSVGGSTHWTHRSWVKVVSVVLSQVSLVVCYRFPSCQIWIILINLLYFRGWKDRIWRDGVHRRWIINGLPIRLSFIVVPYKHHLRVVIFLWFLTLSISDLVFIVTIFNILLRSGFSISVLFRWSSLVGEPIRRPHWGPTVIVHRVLFILFCVPGDVPPSIRESPGWHKCPVLVEEDKVC